MSYQPLPLNIIGGDYKSRSPAWNSQSMVNLYIDQQQSGRTPAALMPWPGEKVFGSSGTAASCRGMWVLNEVVYVIFGRKLYKVTQDRGDGLNNLQDVGDIPGESYCALGDDGRSLFIRPSGGTIGYINQKIILQGAGLTYRFDVASSTVVSLSSSVIEGIKDDEFVFSDVGESESYRLTSKRVVNLTSDPVQQMYVFQQKIIMLGTRSIQFFNDSPSGIVSTQQASTTSVGAASRFSAANTPNYFYFLGNDNVVYRIASYRTEAVSNSSITNELEKVDTSDAIGFSVQLQGQWFYILQMPSADATLAFSESTGEWLRLSTGTEFGFPRHMITGQGYVFGKNIIAGKDDGKLYEWDYNTFTSDGEAIIRQFDTASVNAIALGRPGRRLFANRVTLVMETGTGNNEQPNPKIMFSNSIDGGRSFESEDWISFGRSGDGAQIVDYYMRQSFYDLIVRVRVSDPNFTGFHAATIHVKDGGQ